MLFAKTVYAVPGLTVTTTKTDVSCNGGTNGTATVASVTGGSGPYSYVWSPSGGTAATASGLTAGTYTVTVTDASNASTGTAQATVGQPTVLGASTSQTNVACNGGSSGQATIGVVGGTPAYTYLWTNGATTATISGVFAGMYSVTATDANSCTVTKSFTVTQPSALVTSKSQTNVACNGGSNGIAFIGATGGAGGYSYSWTNGATTSAATGLSAGSYTATVNDANACTSAQTFAITQPAAFTVTPSQYDVSCNGGSNGVASVSVSGGTPS